MTDHRVAAVRRFHRFYTPRIGLLDEGYLASPFSMTQVRVLYELAHRDETTAGELRDELGLDAGYLSRILLGFEQRRLLERKRSTVDGRQKVLSLTSRGRQTFAPLDARSQTQARTLLNRLSASDQHRLVEAMQLIETLLGARLDPNVPYSLRPPRPGDMGWVVHRHGDLYAKEYGWNEQFEALVASIVASFVQHQDSERERCWIAERDGAIVGSVFLVKQSKTVAKLRLLLVEPSARGLGIGSRLVEECVRFARAAGYKKVILWTNNVLDAARHLYQKAGFRLVHKEAHHSFGHDLIGETWELTLPP